MSKLDLRCCDNLELMKEIPDNTVDLIYCDVLYGTGRKFADYQDLKPIRSEIEAHYLPRLIEMKRILNIIFMFMCDKTHSGRASKTKERDRV